MPLQPASAPPALSLQSAYAPDAFTQTIAVRELTAGLVLLSLGLAFLFGALHAFRRDMGRRWWRPIL